MQSTCVDLNAVVMETVFEWIFRLLILTNWMWGWPFTAEGHLSTSFNCVPISKSSLPTLVSYCSILNGLPVV